MAGGLEQCRMCEGPCTDIAHGSVLEHEATYTRCQTCGSVQIDHPSWLDQAYSSAIAIQDVGLVTRCLSASELIATILTLEGQVGATGLDWAGGTGLLTRLMRDLGFPTVHYDPMAQNVHALAFEVSEPQPVTFVTAVECIEHLLHPRQDLAPFVAAADYVFISTELVPEPAPLPDDWWYYSPESGQHITFASMRGLVAVATSWGYPYVTSLHNMHVLSRNPLRARTMLTVRSRVVRTLAREYSLKLVLRGRSLLLSDFDGIVNSD